MLLPKCLMDCTFFLQELESIAAKRVVESLASRSELGQIRTRLQDLEDSRNKWMKKAQARGKMLQDLCTVVKRYIQDVESEKEGAKPRSFQEFQDSLQVTIRKGISEVNCTFDPCTYQVLQCPLFVTK